MACGFLRSQGMASIALSVVGCIDYLAYGTIFTMCDVSSEKKRCFFFPARKATDERWGVVSPHPAEAIKIQGPVALSFFFSTLKSPPKMTRKRPPHTFSSNSPPANDTIVLFIVV
jgi:hypothetical protein